MNGTSQLQPNSPGRRAYLYLAAILAIAASIRLLSLTKWSLWLDEETAIYHALNLKAAFPRCCPVYFYPLNAVFQFTDQYTLAGRIVSTIFGLLSIWLTYEFVAQSVSRQVGLVAALFISLNLYHLFWSQSVRYYTMLFAAEIAASLFFVEGVAQSNRVKLLAAGAIGFIAVWIHYTSVLLLPVWGGYLLLLLALKRTRFTTVLWAAALSIAPFALSMVLALPEIKALQASGATGEFHSSQAMIPLVMGIVFYYGPVLLLLAALSPPFLRNLPVNITTYLALLAALPIAETLVIGTLGLANVTIHHAFASLAGCAALAAITVVGLFESHWKRLSALALGGAVAWSLVMLGLYFTVMYGDRPRWKETAELLKQHINMASTVQPPIYSTAPGVLCHYLGVPADKTMDSKLVNFPPASIETPPAEEAWYVLDAAGASPSFKPWAEKFGQCIGSFQAHTGPRDRTVSIYHIDRQN